MKKKILLVIGIALMLASSVSVCFATYISGSGETDKGDAVSFKGSLDFSGWEEDSGSYSGILSISLTNTGNSGSGALTSLAFLLPENVAATGGNDLGGWTFLEGDFTASGLGKTLYNAGASSKTNGNVNWEGGTPNNGIAEDGSKTFNFGISSQTKIANFTDALANQENFVAIRFQGFDSKGSAKIVGGGSGSTAAVPEPATIFLLGSGLLGLFGYRKKFWKPKN